MLSFNVSDHPSWAHIRMGIIINDSGCTPWVHATKTQEGVLILYPMLYIDGTSTWPRSEMIAQLSAQLKGASSPPSQEVQDAVNAILTPEMFVLDGTKLSDIKDGWVPVTITAEAGFWGQLSGHQAVLVYQLPY